MKLIVIVVRGLQAAATGPYGNRLVETFTLDALAAQGVVFDTHLAVHPDPVAARNVWRTGCHHFPLPADESPARLVGPTDLLAALHAKGVVTRLILDTSRPSPAEWTVGWQRVQSEPDTASAVTAAEETLQELADTPSWLLWLELASLLPPWDLDADVLKLQFAPPPVDEDEEEEEDHATDYLDREEPLDPLLAPPTGPIDPNDDNLYLRIIKTYAAAVSDVDNLLGQFLDGLADDIHVLLTADSGQALGEHAFVGPGRPWLHQEVVHVPLLLVGPGCPPGRHIPALTASIDLAPTIADLAGASLEGAHGRSLLPLLPIGETTTSALRDYVCLGSQADGAIEWGLRTPEWMYLLPVAGGEGERPRLYVKPDDRWEVNDIHQHHLERIEAMEQTLRAYVAACAQPGPLQPPPLRMPEDEAEEQKPGKD